MAYSVHETTVINAPLEKIWSIIGDFNGLPNYHPVVKSSTIIEGEEHKVGAVRLMEIADGSKGRLLLLPFSFSFTHVLHRFHPSI
jgi:NADPH2:quinone reductase